MLDQKKQGVLDSGLRRNDEKRVVMAFCITLLVISLSASAASGQVAAAGIDATQQYQDAYRSDCAFGAPHMELLRRYKVLLVPGYFSDLDPKYFADQIGWLAGSGVEHLRVPVKARQSVAINSPIVARAIRESAKPVILITHSKGSVDTLDALRADASLRSKVAGWVSLQGAFFGSPVADMLLDQRQINPLISAFILEFLGGTVESARNLTTSASRAYYRDHQRAIDEVVREVPAIAFASALEDTPGAAAKTTLQIPFDLMKNQGIRSDGLVPLDAAVLPGMGFVKISGVDHIAPVMPATEPYDRIRMTKALLRLLKPFREVPVGSSCNASR